MKIHFHLGGLTNFINTNTVVPGNDNTSYASSKNQKAHSPVTSRPDKNTIVVTKTYDSIIHNYEYNPKENTWTTKVNSSFCDSPITDTVYLDNKLYMFAGSKENKIYVLDLENNKYLSPITTTRSNNPSSCILIGTDIYILYCDYYNIYIDKLVTTSNLITNIYTFKSSQMTIFISEYLGLITAIDNNLYITGGSIDGADYYTEGIFKYDIDKNTMENLFNYNSFLKLKFNLGKDKTDVLPYKNKLYFYGISDPVSSGNVNESTVYCFDPEEKTFTKIIEFTFSMKYGDGAMINNDVYLCLLNKAVWKANFENAFDTSNILLFIINFKEDYFNFNTLPENVTKVLKYDEQGQPSEAEAYYRKRTRVGIN